MCQLLVCVLSVFEFISQFVNIIPNRDICNDNSDLLTACIDTWSDLNVEVELEAEVVLVNNSSMFVLVIYHSTLSVL